MDRDSSPLKSLIRENLLTWPEVDPAVLHTAGIMVVPELPTEWEFFKATFQQAEFTNLRIVPDARQAISTFREFNPDLVVVGLRTSQCMGGLEVIRDIHSRTPATDYLPILAYTGQWTYENLQAVVAAGAKEVLRMPLDPRVVLLRIKNLLETRLLHLGWELQCKMLANKVAVLTRELEQTREELLERMALIAEYRNDQTGQHIRRVARLVEVVAQTLGLREETAKAVSQAALLHDLGKVGIPDLVLLKPGKLEQEEMEMVRRHTADGARMLSGLRGSVVQLAEEVILYHHERWDGKGYAGLQGESIPLAARIVAVVDAFDAMTHTRPYKKAQSVNRAIVELRRESGKQFDPQVVEALVAVLERKQLPAQAGE